MGVDGPVKPGHDGLRFGTRETLTMKIGFIGTGTVSYTHLTLPTICSV